jgi:hypothetical protein
LSGRRFEINGGRAVREGFDRALKRCFEFT